MAATQHPFCRPHTAGHGSPGTAPLSSRLLCPNPMLGRTRVEHIDMLTTALSEMPATTRGRMRNCPRKNATKRQQEANERCFSSRPGTDACFIFSPVFVRLDQWCEKKRDRVFNLAFKAFKTSNTRQVDTYSRRWRRRKLS